MAWSQETKKVDRWVRIDGDVELRSEWLPDEVFTSIFDNRAATVATAIGAVEEPKTEEARVVDAERGEVVRPSTDKAPEEVALRPLTPPCVAAPPTAARVRTRLGVDDGDKVAAPRRGHPAGLVGR